MKKRCCGIIYSKKEKQCKLCGNKLTKANNVKDSDILRTDIYYEELDDDSYGTTDDSYDKEQTDNLIASDADKNMTEKLVSYDADKDITDNLVAEDPDKDITDNLVAEKAGKDLTEKLVSVDSGEPADEAVSDEATSDEATNDDVNEALSQEEMIKKQIERETILEQIYEDKSFVKDDVIKEKKKKTPLKALGIISLVLAICGLALAIVLGYFLVINPSYDKTGINHNLVYPEVSTNSDAYDGVRPLLYDSTQSDVTGDEPAQTDAGETDASDSDN